MSDNLSDRVPDVKAETAIKRSAFFSHAKAPRRKDEGEWHRGRKVTDARIGLLALVWTRGVFVLASELAETKSPRAPHGDVVTMRLSVSTILPTRSVSFASIETKPLVFYLIRVAHPAGDLWSSIS